MTILSISGSIFRLKEVTRYSRRTGPLEEGSFDLSLLQIAEAVDASILLDCLISPSLF